MKRFSVKVNGQVYEVEVTELKSGESAPEAAYTAPAYSHAAPAPAAAAPLSTGIVHPQPTTYKAPAVKHHSAAVERIMKQAAAGKSEPEAPIAPGGFVVKAPMPGKITFMSAKEGAKVKKGDELMVLEAMKMDLGQEVKRLKADGGASANNYLLQTQADLTGVQVDRPACVETTAMGAAYLAGLAVGFWKNKEEIARGWKADRSFFPKIEEEVRCRMLKGWQKAVRCSYGWAKDGI